MKKLIAQGAEAKILLHKNTVTKYRFQKKYRVPEIDTALRKFRTKREAKILKKLELIGFPSPRVLYNDGKETIEIGYIAGKLVKDVLTKKNHGKICGEIGRNIALMHNEAIIHGDLTTSNILHIKKIYFIDFGLSFISYKVEDKAVDLHVLREALESKHHEIWKQCFDAVLKTYIKRARQGANILRQLKVVEQRGRYKHKK